MRGLKLYKHGEIEDLVLQNELPEPAAEPGHVVVRIAASSFNYHDIFTVRGMPGIEIPLPVTIGLDFAGEVGLIGDGVEGWSVGDRVLVNPLYPGKGLMGEMLDGGMAEYSMVSQEQLIPLPDSVTFEQAAALPVAYGTAHRMLITHKTVKRGDKVLVLGASGGVGTASVVIAKALGAEVIAAVGSDEKAQRMTELGADYVVNYHEDDFSKWVIGKFGKPQRRSHDGGVDAVVNFTGGDTWVPSLKCIKRGGKLLVCGATAGHDPVEDLRYIWSFEINVVGSNSFYDEDLRGLLAMIEKGRLRPVIDRVVPLEDAVKGLADLRDRKFVGKIVVKP